MADDQEVIEAVKYLQQVVKDGDGDKERVKTAIALLDEMAMISNMPSPHEHRWESTGVPPDPRMTTHQYVCIGCGMVLTLHEDSPIPLLPKGEILGGIPNDRP